MLAMLLLVVVLSVALATTLVLLFRARRPLVVPVDRDSHLEQLFETFPHALTLRDLEGRLLRANAEFTRLFQYSVPEVVGVNIDRLLGVPGGERGGGVDRMLTSASKVWRQTRRRRRDGSQVEVSHTGAPLSAGGQTVAFYEVYHDLTQQLRAEATITEQQRLLEAFFTQSLDGFFFMMLDRPIRWTDDADKEALLDYAFAHHRITRVNDAMLAQYGFTRDQMLGLTPADVYAHDPAQGRVAWRRFFDAGRLHTVTSERRADGTPILIEGDYVCLYDEERRITGHFGIQRDITERTRQEEALRESEEKFAKAFRSSPFPITIATLGEGRFLEVNEAFVRDVGFSREEVLGHTSAELGLWRDPEARADLVRRLERDGMVREYEFVAKTRHRDRQINHIWAEKITLKGQDCLLDIVWDVTEWRANEEALRRSRQELRDLAARLQTVREEERTRIARELHDELGQALTGLKMDLAWVRGRLSRTQADLAERLQTLMTRVDGTVDAVRRLATELRPGVLDLLGLVAAIEWQAQEFGRRTGIETDLDLHSDHSAVDDVRATTVFRILQEALTNVARHAHASRTRISFSQTRERLQLEVADNGRGITPDELAGRRSLGLVGIRERAIGCGGELAIEGRPGQGTMVRVLIPCGAVGAEEVVA
jgi:PAS domain S-box-containing protein